MKNINILALLVVIITSCNSDKEKQQLIAQNQETPQLKASIKRGKAVYNDMCITCHLPNGEGVPRAFPPLADSDYLRNNQTESIKAVKYGKSDKITVNGMTYNGTMASLGLSDNEVADVINFINNSWGNSINNFVTPEKVSEL